MGDFPHGPGAMTPSPQCRGPRFNPWSGNWIPHSAAKGSHAAARDPMHCNWGLVQPQKQIHIFLKEGLETAGLVFPGWHVGLLVKRHTAERCKKDPPKPRWTTNELASLTCIHSFFEKSILLIFFLFLTLIPHHLFSICLLYIKFVSTMENSKVDMM